MIEVRQVKWRDARRVCNAHHYLGAPLSHRFSLGVFDGRELLGVMVWGRPIARYQDDGNTLEMTRMCLMAQRKNLGSAALSRAVKWIKSHRAETRLISYSDAAHKGTLYSASGWTPAPSRNGGHWRSGREPRATIRWERIIGPYAKNKDGSI